jgi:poly-gamma-glutamate capsule biosynthesis protein CapA/YwtB (metallophosphatase superfamily)
MRRSRNIRAFVATAPILAALLLAAPAAPGFSQAQPEKGGDVIRIVLTGDSIVNRRLSVYNDPASTGLFKTIQHADAAFTNFETLVHDYAYPGASQSGGAYMSSPSWIPDELKWAGFNLVSTANNHAYDFGEQGLLSTLNALDKAGLAHAGTGANLALARAPAYVDTGKGRFALVAVASTFTDGSLAGEQRPDLIGRPGVNPLGFTTTYTVDQDTFQSVLKVSAIAGRGGGGGGREFEGGGGGGGERARNNGPRTSARIGGLEFQIGDTPGVHTQLNKSDLDALVASVSNAHRQSDWVIVSSHTHESGKGQQSPPDFLVQAAHAAIDAGADVFVSHGPHILRGIEIYKGKPIFYSLGNFTFENETMLFQPAESYDELRLPDSATVADFFDARSGNDTRGFPVNKSVWESAIAEVSFHPDHTLDKITLIPISLGYQEPRSQRGRPRLATPEQAKEVADKLTALSAAYGTTIVWSNGEGVIAGGQK